MLSVGIILSGKKNTFNISEQTTVRELIRMYKNYHNNAYKKISLKTKNLHGIKIDKDCIVKEILYGKIYTDTEIEKDKNNGDYILYAELENPEKNGNCTIM